MNLTKHAVWLINIISLLISTLAAVLMYYYPPRGVEQYTDDGQPHVKWVGDATEQGKIKAKWQRRWAKFSPGILALGFALQLLAATLS